jgi:hypothetical protein
MLSWHSSRGGGFLKEVPWIGSILGVALEGVHWRGYLDDTVLEGFPWRTVLGEFRRRVSYMGTPECKLLVGFP